MATFEQYGHACDDCVIAIANDDYSGLLDFRAREIRAGIAAAPGYLVVGDDRDEFSFSPCDVCGSRLGGARTDVGVMS